MFHGPVKRMCFCLSLDGMFYKRLLVWDHSFFVFVFIFIFVSVGLLQNLAEIVWLLSKAFLAWLTVYCSLEQRE